MISTAPAEPKKAVALAYLPDTSSMTWSDTLGATATVGACDRCHQVDPLFSHPVNVTAPLSIPSDLPLQNGRITCTTCHENSTEAHNQARSGNGSMLRGSLSGAAFCAQCHDFGDGHGATIGKAHLAWPNEQRTKEVVTASGSGAERLDEESRNCLSCHDGSRGQSLGQSHPVGVAYWTMRAAMRRQGMGLIPASGLDDRIRLFDNRVGCGSCHSPYSSHEDLLVMPNPQGRLCLSCHQAR